MIRGFIYQVWNRSTTPFLTDNVCTADALRYAVTSIFEHLILNG